MTSISMPVPFGTGPASFSSSRSTSLSSPSTAAKTAKSKANKTNPPKANTDHRREQNRIASRNYREKRKQKLALLRQILDEPAGSASSADTAGSITGSITGGITGGVGADEIPAVPATLPAVIPGFSGFTNNVQPDMLAHLPSTDAECVAVPPEPSQTATAAAASPSHPLNPLSWMLPGPLPNTTTATTDSFASPSISDMHLNLWTAPFAGSLASAVPAASFSPSLPSLSSLSSVTPSSSTPGDTFERVDALGSASVLDASRDLDLDLDPIMRSDLSFFADMPLADTPMVRPPQPAQHILPSRPSPRVTLSSLTPPAHTTPAASALSGPSRRTRKKNKPVVRAMLQYVQTLSSHQKRLVLQALLDDGEGAGSGRGSDERVEEVDDDDEFDNDDDDDDDDDTDEYSPRSQGTSSTAPSSAVQTLCHQRRREVARRWDATARTEALAAASAAYTGAYLPPTYMTMTLQCRRVAFFTAILQNCAACGLPNPAAMLDDTSCAAAVDSDGNSIGELQSPFALAADDARAVVVQGPARIAAVVAAVRQSLAASGKTPPRDLQPVDAQILVAHHPYMDTIPFRGFRARALALLAEMEAAEEVAAAAHQAANRLCGAAGGAAGVDPKMLDEDELCYDMHVADGLVCWGSQIGNDGMGVSAQAMRDSATTRDMRAGVPWDMRSWEPQVWFLKKYAYLVGGWDDDMWRSCRWWHSMRGEDLDYSVFTAPGY